MSYKELKSFQQATIIYDFTVEFCKRYVDVKSRTTDQMVQAARSGKQNIAEGCESKIQPEVEIKLLDVARFSLGELLEDYEDFLRQRGLRQWGKDDGRALEVRRLVYGNSPDRTNRSDKSDKENRSDKSDRSDRSDTSDTGKSYGTYPTYDTYKTYLSDSEAAANAAICLINQTRLLLDRQILAAEKEFVEKGGRIESLRRQHREHTGAPTAAERLKRKQQQDREADEWLKQFLPKDRE